MNTVQPQVPAQVTTETPARLLTAEESVDLYYLHIMQTAPRPYQARAQRVMDSNIPAKKKMLVLASYMYEAKVETDVRAAREEFRREQRSAPGYIVAA